MKPLTLISLFCLATLSAVGCSGGMADRPLALCTDLHPRPALLFDDIPGPHFADQFAYRSDWPSTLNRFDFGEDISYEVRYYDNYGPWNRFGNDARRIVRATQTGRAYR